MTDSETTGRAAVAMIPDDASVVAQAAIVPHLSTRDQLFVLDAPAPWLRGVLVNHDNPSPTGVFVSE